MEIRTMDEQPLVSIITVSFNSEKTIRDTLESVLAQDYDRIEYLIVDGASTDSTMAIVDSYRSQFCDRGVLFRVSSEKDKGIYDAMDKGIRKSTGSIIGIVNSDDWLEPDAVSTVVGEYKKKQFEICFGSINMIKNEKIAYVKHGRVRRYKTSRDLCHPGMFVTRKAYERLGLYDIGFRLYADLDFWLRAFRNGVDYVVVDKPLSNYRLGGASNRKTLKQTIRSTKEKYACYRRNGYSRLYIFECVFMEMAKYIYTAIF